MKKIKLLTSLSLFSILGTIGMPIASCGNDAEAQLTSIKITTKPNKLTYYVGEKPDLTGMVVTGIMSNGKTKDVTKECRAWPNTRCPLDLNDKYITITHDSTELETKLDITVKKYGIEFEEDSWTNVIKYANEGPSKLQQVYGIPTFVGLEKKININGLDHIVRVIGEEHDIIAGTNTKATLTFELANLLSDSDDNMMESKLDTSNNFDYSNSILRYNLTGNGTPIGAAAEDLWEIPAINMLPVEIVAAIKTVKKQVGYNPTKTMGAENYEITSYNDKLFPLTYTEMFGPDCEKALVEGSPYKYWINHNHDYDREKHIVGRSISSWYCLSSPTTYSTRYDKAWVINGGNLYSNRLVYHKSAVSFAFCI